MESHQKSYHVRVITVVQNKHGPPKPILPFSDNTSNYLCFSLYLLSLSLSGQISLLKQSLELQLSQSQSALQQLQSQFNQERELLSQQLKGELADAPTCSSYRLALNSQF